MLDDLRNNKLLNRDLITNDVFDTDMDAGESFLFRW